MSVDPLENKSPNVSMNISLQEGFLDLKKFEKVKILHNWKFGFVYEVLEKEQGYTLNARISKNIIANYSNDELAYLTQDLNVLSRFSHPLIMKTLGYSPINFNNLPNPVIVTEFLPTTLSDKIHSGLTSTQKLIIIHGIASAMSYLHSHDIIHRDLTTNNILIDINNLPKLANFGFSIAATEIENDDQPQFLSELIGTPLYCSPEILQNLSYSKAGDVYSYSIILYEIITNMKPFKNIITIGKLYTKVVTEDKRPELPNDIQNSYRLLIQNCWSKEPNERPTFDQIVEQLESDAGFITDDVNEVEYRQYIEKVKKSEMKYTQNDRFLKMEDFIKPETATNDPVIFQFSKNIQIDTNKTVDLKNFQKMKEFGSGGFAKIFKATEIETTNVYAAKIYTDEFDKRSIDFLKKLSNEVNIHSYLNHPSIVKYCGFSPTNFEGDIFPVLMTELIPNGTLANVISLASLSLTPHEWDLTKILVNMYGIASAMLYLHSHNVIHGDLNPANVLEDENYHPVICDFGSSNYKETKSLKADDNKGIIAFTAPEALEDQQFSAASDSYSFGLVTFSMLTNQMPFSEITQIFELVEKLKTGYRPEMSDKIPEVYQNLIKRCWSQEPSERPTFSEILSELKDNPDYIIKGIDKYEFLDYIDYIDSYHSTFHDENPVLKIDESYNFEDEEDEDEEMDNIDISYEQILQKQKGYAKFESLKKETCNLNDFEKKAKIGEGSFGSVYKVLEKNIKFIYAAKISKVDFDFESDSPIKSINLNRELDVISSLNHPCILRFIAYNPKNFNKAPKPIIITEYAVGGSLEDILKMERNSISINGWDETKKIINIYGIASSLAYLHSHGIIHRDMKPENVLLSCFLLARLLHEHFKEDERAVHGIEDYCKLAATDIGLYFLELSKEEDQNKENSAKAFEWFEEAYKMKKTSASVNNYALCFLNGIFVERDIEKAKAIFTEGAEKGDTVSMYHLAHILEETDTAMSIEYYRRAAQLGHKESQARYSSMIANPK
ncbi:hypothetical protein M9Y10_016701 [Tritrichomonas musculus]|uniref:Protein kinase domain-containing protein n=1 Tax=Tritrichomonas musculus TaxID=1915356 RepID=A0ABR2HXY5_9EUKA